MLDLALACPDLPLLPTAPPLQGKVHGWESLNSIGRSISNGSVGRSVVSLGNEKQSDEFIA